MDTQQRDGAAAFIDVLRMMKQCSEIKNNVLRGERCWVAHYYYNGKMAPFSSRQTFLFSIAINSSRRLLVSQLCRNASVAGVVYNGVVPSRNLLQREEQGAFIYLIQGLRESEEGVYRVFARVSSSTFDWLLELINV